MFDEAKQTTIIQSFNQIDNRALQDAYLLGCITRSEPARKRPRTGERQGKKGGKTFTYTYLISIDGKDVPVCPAAFQSLHGIGKTRLKRVRTSTALVPSIDGRGRHGRQSQIPDDIKEKIREHNIRSFPKRESHYSRKDNSKKCYLSENRNVKRLWLLYLEHNEPEQRILYRTNKKAMKPVVKYKFYLNLFQQEFNLGFGQPRSDTCPICDKLNNEIKAADDIEKKKAIESKREIHQLRAETAYQKLQKYTKLSKENANIEMFTFDFQQNLPCPNITAGDMFYSRMLWTYNFGIHDSKTDDGIMHIWSEAEAGRGSSEVASCLRRTILQKHEKYGGEHLILFSDGCPGQNKNKAIVSLLLSLVTDGHYKSIQHFFLFRGHTFLPNDRDFSHIEKRKRVEQVFQPGEWQQIIKESRLSQPFEVQFLTHADIFDYKTFSDARIKSSLKCVDGNPLKFKEAMWFSYGISSEMNATNESEIEHIHTNEVWCRYTHSHFETWKKVNFLKRNSDICGEVVPRKYDCPVGIKVAKKNDLINLCRKGLIAPSHLSFYQNLPVRKTSLAEDDDADDYVKSLFQLPLFCSLTF